MGFWKSIILRGKSAPSISYFGVIKHSVIVPVIVHKEHLYINKKQWVCQEFMIISRSNWLLHTDWDWFSLDKPLQICYYVIVPDNDNGKS